MSPEALSRFLLVAASLLFTAGVDWLCAAGLGCPSRSRARFQRYLVALASQDDRDPLAVVAIYSLFMGFQMLLTMYFLFQHHTQKPIEPPSALNRASV